MPENQEKIGQFEPVHAAHAIEQVVFALQFDHPLEEAAFASILQVAEQFAEGSVKQMPILELAFVVDANVPSPPNPMPVPKKKGASFRKTAPDGTTVTHEFLVERNSITFRTTLYSRWDAIWQQANKYFSALAPMYAEHAKLISINLNYVDKFVWSGDISKFKPSLLLREGSKYICPHVYELQEMWHSHTGVFIRADQQTRRLLNVNIDAVDENVPDGIRRVVVISTVLLDQLNQASYEESNIRPDGIVSFVNQHMLELHKLGKEVLGNTINEEMCKRIALME